LATLAYCGVPSDELKPSFESLMTALKDDKTSLVMKAHQWAARSIYTVREKRPRKSSNS
jgi:hypothetical protein